jgi:hypothetical protein
VCSASTNKLIFLRDHMDGFLLNGHDLETQKHKDERKRMFECVMQSKNKNIMMAHYNLG